VEVSVEIRSSVNVDDHEALDRLLRATGFFNGEEHSVALELVSERIAEGEGSHYRFLVAEEDGEVLGYACWGPILGTVASVDLYWIAVDPQAQGRGVGKALMEMAEAQVAAEGRSRVYLETSSRAQYVPTRAFYLRCGYSVVAELEDFYAPGDGKVVFLKVLPPAARA
jgi:ribosomal protein S18 acetylase RimI-like enzyme